MKYTDFLPKAIKIHGDKYTYEDFGESSVIGKINIICPIHGKFEQAIYAHLRGQGCPKCIGERRGYTTETFIIDAKNKFGDKFDYSKTEYKNRRTKVCIMYDGFKSESNPNGEFWQLPFTHLNSSTGLPFTGQRGKKYNEITDVKIIEEKTKKFIEKAKIIHGDNIDFSKTIYRGCNQKAIFICPIHGEFEAMPSNVIRGHRCPKCAKNSQMTKEEFILDARKIHGEKYDYTETEIKKADDKVCIICHEKDENGVEHGRFWQTINKHLHGSGCHICAKNKKDTLESFIEKARKVHGNKYDYSKVVYVNSRTKVCIICPIHGEFWQTPASHLSGKGCPICSESKLEEEICLFLERNNIEYERQKTYSNIKYKYPLPFDFYLPKYNTIIECQGEQHFKKRSFFNDPNRLLKDKIKYDGCLSNKIKILYYTNLKKYQRYFDTMTYNSNNLFGDKTKLLNEIKKS